MKLYPVFLSIYTTTSLKKMQKMQTKNKIYKLRMKKLLFLSVFVLGSAVAISASAQTSSLRSSADQTVQKGNSGSGDLQKGNSGSGDLN